jgi:hypothetical protein
VLKNFSEQTRQPGVQQDKQKLRINRAAADVECFKSIKFIAFAHTPPRIRAELLASSRIGRGQERGETKDPFSFTGARAPHNPVNKKLIENLHGGYFLYRVSGQEITHAPGVIKSGGSALAHFNNNGERHKKINIHNKFCFTTV